MKKLIIAAAAMLAVTLVSGGAFAFTGNQAKGIHVQSGAVKVNGVRHRVHRRSGCAGCASYIYTTRYTTCGTCGGCGYGGCGCPAWNWCGYGYGCGGCGCGHGYYGGGWSIFGWLF